MEFSLTSVTLQQINIFINVVETGGFAKASTALLMTQSAVSKSIAKLEQSLGITLFHRSTREVNLTEAGTLLYNEWKPILQSINNGYIKARAIQNESTQVLNIGIMNTARPDKYLKNFSETFNIKYPDISVIFDSQYLSELEVGLGNEKYDAIMLPDFERFSVDDIGFKWKWVACSTAYVIVPKNHHLSSKKALKTKDILNEKLSELEEHQLGSSFRRDIKERFKPYGVTPNFAYKYKNAFNVMFNLNANNSLSIVDKFFDYPENDHSVLIPLTDQTNGIICAWNPKRETLPLKKFLSSFNVSPASNK